ncbi:hypothetical protein [Mycoplasmopsis caviae]|nr:hypothetical protein [Mycoplasmopsis caviae]VDR42562.1 Uncharacterised protein [Mycoplasmopsis caviae]
MKKQSSAFVGVSLLQTSIIIVLFVIGMIEAIKGAGFGLLIYGAVGFTLALQIVILFFAFVFKKTGNSGKIGTLLIIFLFLMLAATIISLSYTICFTQGANIKPNGQQVFGIVSSI